MNRTYHSMNGICQLKLRLEDWRGLAGIIRFLVKNWKQFVDSKILIWRIFTELGESFLLRMVSAPPSSPHFTIPILDTVLLCCSHPDYELPDVTFNLWYRLSEELYSRFIFFTVVAAVFSCKTLGTHVPYGHPREHKLLHYAMLTSLNVNFGRVRVEG